ncbi:MAG: hypothetical protein AAF961_12785, partial [Planctomycetota bacterium]
MNPSDSGEDRRFSTRCRSSVRLAAAAAAIMTSGCQSMQAPSAAVLPQTSVTYGDERTNLRSATVRYATAVAGPRENPAGVAQAAFDQADIAKTRRLLAIRYPHPDGRVDAARAELVVARVDKTPPSGAAAWSQAVGKAFRAYTPGVAWGDGIVEAKALDVTVAELQYLLESSQAVARHGVRRAQRAPQIAPGRLHLEINGDLSTSGVVQAAELDALASRIAREGVLISCRTPARELFADLPEPPDGVISTAT